jgi:hypothetical protein
MTRYTPVKDTRLTQSWLRRLITYEPETGNFYKPDGQIAGSCNHEGYRRIYLCGTSFPAHRLAFFWLLGRWPKAQVDHINGDPGDNRWCNLREATQTQNKANSRVYKNNRLGVKGVRLHRNGTYEARIRVNGKLIYLGCSPTIEEAKEVYAKAAQKYFGDFARLA